MENILNQSKINTIVISNDDGIYEGNVWELRKVVFSLFKKNNIELPKIITLVPIGHASAQSCYRSTIDDGKTRDQLLESVKKFKSIEDFNSNNEDKLQINQVIGSNEEFGYEDIYYFNGRPADMSEIFNHHKYFKDIKKVDLLISGPNNLQNQTKSHIMQAGTIGLINVALIDKSDNNKFKNSLAIAISNVSGEGLNISNIADNYHDSEYINKFDQNIKTVINDALEKKNQFGEELNGNILNYNFSMKQSTANQSIHLISDDYPKTTDKITLHVLETNEEPIKDFYGNIICEYNDNNDLGLERDKTKDKNPENKIKLDSNAIQFTLGVPPTKRQQHN